MFEEHVGTAVEPDHEGLDEFSRWHAGFPLANLAAGRLLVPAPPHVGKTPHPTSQGEQSIPEEDSSLDKVGQTIEDVFTTLGLVSIWS